ncbi:hypothetical protein HQ520_16735, partial [bacterium]|nr:hypothetical protein [bacterium]
MWTLGLRAMLPLVLAVLLSSCSWFSSKSDLSKQTLHLAAQSDQVVYAPGQAVIVTVTLHNSDFWDEVVAELDKESMEFAFTPVKEGGAKQVRLARPV